MWTTCMSRELLVGFSYIVIEGKGSDEKLTTP
jgi:hypothetical protein